MTILDYFDNQVKDCPDKEAVIYGNSKVTYAELDKMSNSIAWTLKEKGIVADDVVAIITERSIEMIACILGIMKSGAAYLPIAYDNPCKRTEYILRESKCKVIICEGVVKRKLASNAIYIDIKSKKLYSHKVDKIKEYPKEKDLAYVIYTSGSTGVPKGVMIEHRALLNRLIWMQDKYPLSQKDTLIQKTPYTFDVSVWEILWWIIPGARVYLMEPYMEKFPQAIIKSINEYNITVIHFVPSMMDVFLDYIEKMDIDKTLRTLKRVFCSGEQLTANHVKKFNKILYSKNKTHLTNLYGPTEAAIDVTYYDCPSENEPDVIPIGQPIYNTEILILNDKLEEVEKNTYGEICISGVCLSRGYIHNKEMTDRHFVFYKGKQRIYKTGDIGRRLQNGMIEYKERKDHQVKIRGLRIELTEIDKVIEAYQEGIYCITIAKKVSDSITYINSFIKKANEIDINDLKNYMKQHLPVYMIPNNICFIDKIPLTDNGKVNRKALEQLQVERNRIIKCN